MPQDVYLVGCHNNIPILIERLGSDDVIAEITEYSNRDEWDPDEAAFHHTVISITRAQAHDYLHTSHLRSDRWQDISDAIDHMPADTRWSFWIA